MTGERGAGTRIIRVECPVCGSRLKGAVRTGFRCVGCGAYYSTARVRHLQKHHLRSIIHRHFSHDDRPPRTDRSTTHEAPTGAVREDGGPRIVRQEETERVVIADDDGRITKAIMEAKASVQGATQHLEDLLASQQTEKEASRTDEPVGPSKSADKDVDEVRGQRAAATRRRKGLSPKTAKKRRAAVRKKRPRASRRSKPAPRRRRR